jgi:hypothetical protein
LDAPSVRLEADYRQWQRIANEMKVRILSKHSNIYRMSVGSARRVKSSGEPLSAI